MLYDLAVLLVRTMEGGPGFLVVLLVWVPIQSAALVAIHEAGHALAALVTAWLASRTGPGNLDDFLALMTFGGLLFGCLLNLIPLTEGTPRRPGTAVRTDGGIVLDIARLLSGARVR